MGSPLDYISSDKFRKDLIKLNKEDLFSLEHKINSVILSTIASKLYNYFFKKFLIEKGYINVDTNDLNITQRSD